MELEKEAVETFQAIIQLQNWLNNLDMENYAMTKNQILKSIFVKTDERVRVLLNEFLYLNRIFEPKMEIIVDMIQSLSKSGSQKNCLEKFKQMLYTELVDWVSCDNPEPNLMLLRQCATKNIYTIDQILTTFNKSRPSEEEVYPYVFLAFAPEIDQLHHKEYKKYIKILYKYNGSNPLIKRCVEKYPQELRRDRYKILGQMFQFGYEIVCLQYVLKFDKLDTLQQYLSMEDFDPHKKLENGAFDIITHTFLNERQLIPIEMAALYGSEKCFKLLHITFQELTEDTALYACIGGNQTIISIIDKAGGSFGKGLAWAAAYRKNILVEWIVKEKKPSQQYLNAALEKAIEFDNAYAVLFLLQNGAVPTLTKEAEEKKIMTSSGIAARFGNLEILNFLHNCGFGDPQRDAEIAALYGKLPVLQALISRGADVHKVNETNGKTLLHFAAEGGSSRVLSFLLRQEVEVNVRDKMKRYPIHYACKESHYRIVKELMLHGSEVTGEDANGVAISEMATNEDIKLILKTAKAK